MVRKSAAAQERHNTEKDAVEAELAEYQQMVRALWKSGESKLAQTHKQREYHKKIQELQQQLQRLGK
jgi:hypothetical protein